jgi:AcrR family transcriptional regulator
MPHGIGVTIRITTTGARITGMGRKKLHSNRNELILDAASELFAVVGYDKTTLDEIAERAGISKGSIYLEFDSKQEILFTLISRYKEAQLLEMRRLADSGKSHSALATLKAMLVQNVGTIYESVMRNQRSPEEVIQSRERLRVRLKPFLDARLALIEEMLCRAEQTGEISPLKERRRTAQLLMMALRAVLPPYEAGVNKIRLQHEAAELLELVMKGLHTS